jgi:ferredoxin
MTKIKRIKIDKERCIGCGSCASLVPDAFALDIEEGKAEVKKGWEKISPDDIRRACTACPVQAITLEED